MASSNKHWPSMFRANPACGFQPQPQSDMMYSSHGSSSLLSDAKPSFLPSGMKDQQEGSHGGRSTETKARWSPRAEQIRILEAIFNGGAANPSREEIRRIRARLQEFGPVADANVFYWFQNRKSRAKNKLRAAAAAARQLAPSSSSPVPVTPPRKQQQNLLLGSANNSSSSSSSSERSSSSGGGKAAASVVQPPPTPLPPPVSGIGQLYYQYYPMRTPAAAREMVVGSPEPQGQQYCYCLPATELGGVVLGSGGRHAAAIGQQDNMVENIDKGPSFCDTDGRLYSSINAAGAAAAPEGVVSGAMMSGAAFTDDKPSWLGGGGLLHHASAAASDVISTAAPAPSVNAAASSALTDQLQLQELLNAGGLNIGGECVAAPMATVVAMAAAGPNAGAVQCYSVPAMARLDAPRLFGEAALLLRHTGEPVPVDAANGVTLDHGALYYVLV